MTNLDQRYAFPRISTRGYYDLWTGESLHKNKNYFLYPKKKFKSISYNAKELVIFVHGMRNTRWGAKRGALTLRQTLRGLGYKNHPVVAFSYDANVRGAHLQSEYERTLKVAEIIASSNGKHLSQYIKDLIENNPKIKIHLVGHSLGCEVVYWALFDLRVSNKRDNIKSSHLFGSPVEYKNISNAGKFFKIINYYNPTDEVIIEGVSRGTCKLPTCLVKKVPNVINKTCIAKDHRFKSYAEKLKVFP